MRRLFWSAFALACGIVQASSAPPVPQDDSGSAPMRFEWRREGPAQACGANCRVWISAIGYITADTPREFETFAKDPNARGAVLVLDSDGGSVLGTLALGRAIRSLGMITTIGKTTALPSAGKAAQKRAYASSQAHCRFHRATMSATLSLYPQQDNCGSRAVMPSASRLGGLGHVLGLDPNLRRL